MDNKTIFTKTAKGLREATGKTRALSRRLRIVLKEVDGKSSVEQLLGRFEGLQLAVLRNELDALVGDDYIREFVQTAAVEKAVEPVEDLDFSSLPPSSVKAGEPDADKGPADALRKAQEAEAKAKVEAQAKKKAEEQARQVAEAQARREAGEKARQEAAEKTKREAEAREREKTEIQARREAEERLKREIDEHARRDAEAKAKREAEEAAHRKAEERARRETEEKTRQEAEKKARQETEERARRETEEKARQVAEAQARREADEKARQEAAEKAKREAEAREREKAEIQARREAEERLKREIEEKTRQAAEEAARKEAEEQARREAEERARREAEEKAKREAEEKARWEAEEQARREAEERARREAEERAKREAEEKARREAEEQARREAEERARREAEERAKREAEEKARREAEERARREAEEERARREAEEKARREAEAQAKREAKERTRREAKEKARLRAEQKAAAKSERASDGKQINWTKVAMLGLFVLIALGLGLVHMISFDGQAVRLEKLAADQFGQPVKIKSVHLALFPQPRWNIEGIVIGGEGQIKVDRIKAVVDLGAMFDDKKVFSSLEFYAPVMNGDGLRWLMFGKPRDAGIKCGRVSAIGAKLDSKNISLPSFDVKADIGDDGNWRKVLVFFSEKNGVVELQPKGDRVQMEINADAFAVPFGSSLALGSFTATGTIGRDDFSVTEFKGRLHGGFVSGTARLKWGAGWSLDGDLSARQIASQQALPGLLESGEIEGTGVYSLRAADAANLFAAPHLEGTFVVRDGVLLGVNLANLLKSGGNGGKTPFSELAGSYVQDGGRTQLRQVHLAAGIVSAAGGAESDANGNIRGRFASDLKYSTGQAHANIAVSGSLKEPRFSR